MTINHATLNDPNVAQREADQISQIVAEYADPLRNAKIRGRRRIDGLLFRFFRADRNVIYRVTGQRRWYLKLPTNNVENVVHREESGAAGAAKALTDDPRYRHPQAARFSARNGYILYPELPGITSNQLLYRTCYSLRRGMASSANEMFGAIGHALARLHSHKPDAELPPANRSANAALEHSIERVRRHSDMVESIARWHEGVSLEPIDEVPLVHANLVLENVLLGGGKLTFIDFENCGSGVVYDDLSFACTRLLLTEAVPLFPHKRVRSALCAFLDGYQETRPLDRDLFVRFAAMRVARYYLENYGRGKRVARVGGLPLSRARLERLLLALQRGDLASVVPDIRL